MADIGVDLTVVVTTPNFSASTGSGTDLPISSDDVEIDGVGDLTTVLTGLGALVPLVSDLETTVDGLGNDVTDLEAADTALDGRLDTAEATLSALDTDGALIRSRMAEQATRATAPTKWAVCGVNSDTKWSTDFTIPSPTSTLKIETWVRVVGPARTPGLVEIIGESLDGTGNNDRYEVADWLRDYYGDTDVVDRADTFAEGTAVGATAEWQRPPNAQQDNGATAPTAVGPWVRKLWIYDFTAHTITTFYEDDVFWDYEFHGRKWATIGTYTNPGITSLHATADHPTWIGRSVALYHQGHIHIWCDDTEVLRFDPTTADADDTEVTDSVATATWTGTDGAVIAEAPSTGGGVPTSRTITAGTGLTGGGTLAADRTLAIDAAVLARLGTSVDAATDLTRTTTTLADDGELTFTGTSGTRYWIDAFVALSGDATADAKVGIVIPGGTMCVMAEHPAANISTYPTTQQMTVLTASAATAQVGVLAGGTTVCRLSGWVDLTSSGTVCVHWAQNNTGAATGVTRLAKSRINYRS